MLAAGLVSWGGIAHLGLIVCVGASGALVVIEAIAMLILFPVLRRRLALVMSEARQRIASLKQKCGMMKTLAGVNGDTVRSAAPPRGGE
jgi:hypothetical protein